MIYPANGRGRGSGLFLLLLFPRRFRCRVLVKKHRLMKQDAVDCMDRDDDSSIVSIFTGSRHVTSRHELVESTTRKNINHLVCLLTSSYNISSFFNRQPLDPNGPKFGSLFL